MASIRDALNRNPWIGWGAALLFFCVAIGVYVVFGRGTNVDPYNPERMTEMISVRYDDTGEIVQMRRGDFDRNLRRAYSGTLDAGKGLINPKTGQPTGFLFDKKEWDAMIGRINAERQKYGAESLPNQPATANPGTAPGAAPPAPGGSEPKPDQPR